MKRIIGFVLALSIVLGFVPSNVFAYHKHFYESVVTQNDTHPHKCTLECNCGATINLPITYNFYCRECREELCCKYGIHNYHHITSGDNWVNAECDCGECVYFDSNDDWLKFSENKDRYAYNLCRKLNVELANDTNTSAIGTYSKEVDISSLFSKSIERSHPHAGYYKTRSGEEAYLKKAYNGRCEQCIEELCENYDAHSFLYDYDEYDDHVLFRCYCGKTIKVSYARLDDFLNDRENDNIEICNDINLDLAVEAYYDNKYKTDNFTFKEPMYASRQEESTLGGTFNGPHVFDGKVSITSELTSNYNITYVYVYVTDQNGTKVTEAQISPNSKNVSVDENSEINRRLQLEKLPTGTYTVFLEVSDSSGTTGDASIGFDLTQNNCSSTESNLTIDFTCIPKTIREPGGFGLRGSVTSNYNITEVYGYIKDTNNNVLISSYDAPNATFMDIQYARLNKDLVFNNLHNGNYYIVVVAHDVSGAETVLEHRFSVERGTYDASKNNSSSLIGGKYTVEEWNDLFGHIIFDGAFSPQYMDIKKDSVSRISALEKSTAIRNYKKGETLYITGKCTNKYGNIWYITETSNGSEYIYSGNLQSHTHACKKYTINNIDYHICNCGYAYSNSSNGTNNINYAAAALPLAAVDGLIPAGDIIAAGIVIIGLCEAMKIAYPSIQEIASALSDVDFNDYLQKRNSNNCSPYTFRKVMRRNGHLKYIDKFCMDVVEAYLYVRITGGDVYTESEDSAMMLAAMHGSGICERDKDQMSYFYHYHLGTERNINGHIFFGTNDYGEKPLG